jgi:hypothetical protein
MSVDDGLDYVTWHPSWQNVNIVSKGDKACGGGQAGAGTLEKSSCERWR